MVLGCYYLSVEKEGAKNEGKFFSEIEEVERAYELGWIELQTKIIFHAEKHSKIQGFKYLVTTPGKLFFNRDMPEKLVYINDSKINDVPYGVANTIEEAKDLVKSFKTKPFDKKFLGILIDYAFDKCNERFRI
jgi:DNA-directed RNA polymerase subunit beta'